MKTWLVTRHPGAVFWAAKAGVKTGNSSIVESLDPSVINDGDKVIGTLPIHLVEQVIRRGGTYFHIAMDLPEEARGKELTEKEMKNFNARLEQYYVANLGTPQTAHNNELKTNTVMLVIASGQSLPNLLPMLAMTNPISHLYIAVSESSDAKVSAKKIENVINLLDVPVTVFKNTPSAPLKMVHEFAQKCFKKIRSAHPDARIIFNSTGGTKMMSSGFSNALGPAGEVIYCDTANDSIEYFHPQDRPYQSLAPDLLSLEVYLMSQGQEIVECASHNEEWMARAIARKALTKTFVEKLAGHNPESATNAIGQLNSLIYKALPGKKGNKIEPFASRQTMKSIGVFNARIESHQLWTRIDDATVELASEEAARYLGGGWLEEYAALTMEELGIPKEHWGVGVKIRPMQGVSAKLKDGNSLNELDLAIVWRNRLLVIECKTGAQLDEAKASQDILNKIEAIRSYAGGSFGTSWALSSRLIKEDSTASARANEYRIDVFEREALVTLRHRIAEWMHLPLDEKSKAELEENNIKCQTRVRSKNSNQHKQAKSAMAEAFNKQKKK